MRTAEVQPAPALTAVRFAAAHIGQAAIDLFVALWMIALGRHAVADVALPVRVEPDSPTHGWCPPLKIIDVHRHFLLASQAYVCHSPLIDAALTPPPYGRLTMTTTSTAITAIRTITVASGRPFASGAQWGYRAHVEADGSVRVYDDVARHYTACHSLSPAQLAYVRRMAR